MGITMSRLLVVGLVLLAGVVSRVTYEQLVNPSDYAAAQADQFDCASFGSRESAQAELERDPSDTSNLDPDGNPEQPVPEQPVPFAQTEAGG